MRYFVTKLAQPLCYNAEHYYTRTVPDTIERIIKRDIIGGETPKNIIS
jgi:(2Fe-2S) ferredoxin